MLKKFTNKIHDFFHYRPVLVLVIELLYVALMAFALCLPAIKGDDEMLRITGYMDTELWYAAFAFLAINVCCADGVHLCFEEYRKRKGDVENERTNKEAEKTE